MESAQLPFFGSASGSDAKKMVVELLSQGFELNARQIHRQITQKHSSTITYQGIHKAVKLLLSQGVLEKNGKGYFLSPVWVSKIKDFGDQFAEAKPHANITSLIQMSQNTTTELCLNGLFVESFNLLLSATEKIISSQTSKTPLISHSKHAWAMTVVSDRQYKQLKEIANVKHYILCSGKTLMDEFLLDFWKKQLNANWRYYSKAAEKCDLVVADDFVVQIFHEPAFAKKWAAAYSSVKTKKDVELSKLYKLIFEQPTKTKLVITRNEALAEQIRSETLSHFNKTRTQR